ncbi:MAG: hypothetical protein ACI9W2_004403, partial [Gammaproteobacteria bacterium]
MVAASLLNVCSLVVHLADSRDRGPILSIRSIGPDN